jgi:hypothetical protein
LPCELDLTRAVTRGTAKLHGFAIIRGVDGARCPAHETRGKGLTVLKLITALAVVALAFASAGQASAKTQVVATPIVKKLPRLNVSTHPNIPRICPNELSKGPGAKKCG